jgi:periplasmic divalent cation tolerance protein
MKRGFIIIIVTCGSAKEAGAIARYLLEERLIACANVIPGVKSKYWWQGRIEAAEESIMLLKTKKKNFKLVEREIKRLHSYDMPEIMAVPVSKGSRDYLKWLDESIRRR